MYFLYLCSCAGEESFYSSVRVMNFDHEHVILCMQEKNKVPYLTVEIITRRSLSISEAYINTLQ